MGVGVALISLRYWIARASLISVVLRFVIAAGFVPLGFATLRSARPPTRGPANGSASVIVAGRGRARFQRGSSAGAGANQ